MGVSVYHDNPNVTDFSIIRQSAFIELSKPIKANGEVKEGNCVTGTLGISFSEFEKAWQGMMIGVEENEYKLN